MYKFTFSKEVMDFALAVGKIKKMDNQMSIDINVSFVEIDGQWYILDQPKKTEK